jgi:outer membrane cobalamin receptor
MTRRPQRGRRASRPARPPAAGVVRSLAARLARLARLAPLALAALALALGPPSAEAAAPARADAPDPERELVLDDIVVRAPAPLGAGAGTVTTLGEDELRRREARTAAEALATAPGVRVVTTPLATTANGKQEVLLSIRGFDATDVKVLIDGVPVEDPYQGTVDLARLPLEGVAGVTVARGPTSLLYGPNALGGVVNLVSAQPPPRLALRLRLELDDALSRRVSARLSAPLGPVALLTALSVAQTDGFRVPHGFEAQRNEGGGVRDNAFGRDLGALVKATWQLPHDQRVQLSLQHVDFRGGVPFSVSALEPGTLWRRSWRRTQAEAAGVVRAGDVFAARGKLYYTRFDNTVTTFTDASMTTVALDGDAVSTHVHDGLGLFASPELRLGRWAQVTLAGSWRIDWLSIEDDRSGAAPLRRYRSEQVDVALEVRGHPLPWLTLLAGASYVGFFKERAAGGVTGIDPNDLEVLVGLRASPWVGGELHAGWARKVGLPRLRQLYGAFGDPDLRPQHASSWEAGLRQSLELGRPARLELAATWFRCDVSDYIGKYDTGNEVQYRNVDEALLTGLEADAALRLFTHHTLDVAYTWLHTRDRRPERVVETLDFRPPHTLDVALGASFPFGLEANVALRWTSAQAFETPTASGPTRHVFPGRVQLDLGVSHTLRFDEDRQPGRTLRVYARLLNALDALAAASGAFDVYHEDAPERPGAGWGLRMGVEATF